MGFSFALGFKMEWAFRMQFWPLKQAVCLDMFQLSSFFYFIFDKGFAAFVGYLKFFASEEMKQQQAGRLGERFKKRADGCKMVVCSKCRKMYDDILRDEGYYKESEWKGCHCRECFNEKGQIVTLCGDAVECGGQLQCDQEGSESCCRCGKARDDVDKQRERIQQLRDEGWL